MRFAILPAPPDASPGDPFRLTRSFYHAIEALRDRAGLEASAWSRLIQAIHRVLDPFEWALWDHNRIRSRVLTAAERLAVEHRRAAYLSHQIAQARALRTADPAAIVAWLANWPAAWATQGPAQWDAQPDPLPGEAVSP